MEKVSTATSPEISAKLDYICKHIKHLKKGKTGYAEDALSVFNYDEVAYVKRYKEIEKIAKEASDHARIEYLKSHGLIGGPPYKKALEALFPNNRMKQYHVIQGSVDAGLKASAVIFKEEWYDHIEAKLFGPNSSWENH